MISYLEFEGLPEEPILTGILRLHERVFGEGQSERVRTEAAGKQRLLTIVAMSDGQVVGYKIGYERKPEHFCSWIGAVAQEFRKRGIGTELMRLQHQWCRVRGYRAIRTTTKNKWRDMIVLNLRSGFDIIGAYTDEKGEPKLILEKRLDAGEAASR